MKKLSLLALGAGMIISSPALAQSGPYIGVIGGYDSVTLEAGGTDGSEGDVMYGVVAGYDHALSTSAIIGLEAEYSDSSVSDTATDVLALGDSLTLAAGRDLYLGIRSGYVIGESTLLYLKVGYTNAKIEGEYDDGSAVLEDSDTLDGYRLGAGLEHNMGPFAIRAEYRFSDYGEYAYEDINTGVSARRHQVVGGILAKF